MKTPIQEQTAIERIVRRARQHWHMYIHAGKQGPQFRCRAHSHYGRALALLTAARITRGELIACPLLAGMPGKWL